MNQFWHDKKVLITGATGLVGSWLTKALVEKNAHVSILVRDLNPQSELLRTKISEKTTIVQGSLEDFNSVERAINENEIDTVFHLGAQTIVGTAHRSPLPTFEANIRGSYNLLEACRRLQSIVKRVVVASSDKAYGSSDVLPYTEEMPLQGRHPYDVSKSCTDLLAFTYAQTYNLPVAVARCGNIYGGGDLNWSRIIPGTIRSLHQGMVPIIRSNGLLTRDYIFVQDVVEAYLLLAEKLGGPGVVGQAFNFGPNQPLSALDIVKLLQDMMGFKDVKPHILGDGKGEIQDQSLDSTKAQKILGWQMNYSLEDGFAKTISWYQNYLQTEALLV